MNLVAGFQGKCSDWACIHVDCPYFLQQEVRNGGEVLLSIDCLLSLNIFRRFFLDSTKLWACHFFFLKGIKKSFQEEIQSS